MPGQKTLTAARATSEHHTDSLMGAMQTLKHFTAETWGYDNPLVVEDNTITGVQAVAERVIFPQVIRYLVAMDWKAFLNERQKSVHDWVACCRMFYAVPGDGANRGDSCCADCAGIIDRDVIRQSRVDGDARWISRRDNWDTILDSGYVLDREPKPQSLLFQVSEPGVR